MKLMRNILLTWMIITLFLVILLVAYNKLDDRYLSDDKNLESTTLIANNNMSDRYVDMGEDAQVPSELHPVVERNKNTLLEQTTDINIDVIITNETRSMDEQNELYAQGRSASGDIVTNARGGESYHNYGLAIDYALRLGNGEITWNTQYDGNNNGTSDWLEVAELAKDLGFEWGGDWRRFPDYPHLQMDFGLSISQLQDGVRVAYNGNTEE